MATVLYRLGRLSYRRRGPVLLAWLVLLALAGAGAVTLSGPTSSSFSIPGTESQRASDLLAERLPEGGGADNASARIVFTAEGSGRVTDPERAAAIQRAGRELAGTPHVAAVVDAIEGRQVSPDGRTAFTTVAYDVQGPELAEADRETLQRIGEAAESAGLRVEFGGTALQEPVGASVAEVLGLAVAAVVLVITFGSLVAAGLPLVTALIGVGIGAAGIMIVSGLTDLSSTTLILAVMLGLAVAIDYALFIVSRYRHELREGIPLGRGGEEAIGRATGTAGSAVVFAGLTVVIALAALSVAGIPFLTQMGLAAAATVAVAVLIALTLLPALLGFTGMRILRGRRVARETGDEGGKPPLGERWATGVVRHRWAAAVLSVVALGVVAVPALDLRLALPSDGSANEETTQRQAYDQLAASFGPGFNGPLIVAADLAGVPAAERERAVGAVQQTLAGLPDVAVAVPAGANPAGDLAIVSVVPESAPTDAATEDLVHAIRGLQPADTAGADLSVTGETAVNIDVSEKLAGALLPYLAVVVGLAFLLLALVFRSVLVPLKATLGFLLSVAATFGAVVAVFQWGWLGELIGVTSTGPILNFLPIILIGILFGLAMDYEVFLVTRMREEHVHGATADRSVVLGFRHGARVVTAAGIIMISVFAGFVFTHDPIIKSVGFALAFGVLVDAFVVRMTLVPAVMSLLGDRAWWIPRRLDRVLPDVDVEGEKLTRALDARPVTSSGTSEPQPSSTAASPR